LSKYKAQKNEKTATGKQKFYCYACGKYGTLHPEPRYTEERKAEMLRAYQERSSLRGIERSFGVARQTVAFWLKKSRNYLI
jgi:transposase-like protein